MYFLRRDNCLAWVRRLDMVAGCQVLHFVQGITSYVSVKFAWACLLSWPCVCIILLHVYGVFLNSSFNEMLWMVEYITLPVWMRPWCLFQSRGRWDRKPFHVCLTGEPRELPLVLECSCALRASASHRRLWTRLPGRLCVVGSGNRQVCFRQICEHV